MGDTTIRQAGSVATVSQQTPAAKPASAEKPPAPPDADRLELNKPKTAEKKAAPAEKTTFWQDVKDFFRLTAKWSWLLG